MFTTNFMKYDIQKWCILTYVPLTNHVYTKCHYIWYTKGVYINVHPFNKSCLHQNNKIWFTKGVYINIRPFSKSCSHQIPEHKIYKRDVYEDTSFWQIMFTPNFIKYDLQKGCISIYVPLTNHVYAKLHKIWFTKGVYVNIHPFNKSRLNLTS